MKSTEITVADHLKLMAPNCTRRDSVNECRPALVAQ
jgi:hypothetical protein